MKAKTRSYRPRRSLPRYTRLESVSLPARGGMLLGILLLLTVALVTLMIFKASFQRLNYRLADLEEQYQQRLVLLKELRNSYQELSAYPRIHLLAVKRLGMTHSGNPPITIPVDPVRGMVLTGHSGARDKDGEFITENR